MLVRHRIPAPTIGPFMGEGVFFSSDVHSVAPRKGNLSPIGLIEVLAAILDYQKTIVQEQGGLIEQFVGGCVIAYWPPSSGAAMVEAAFETGARLVREKVEVAELDYCIRVKFVASELAGAFFGSKTTFRYQVVGKARDRANELPNLSDGKDCVLTNQDTLGKLPLPVQNRFTLIKSAVFALNLETI
jgi:class 3 adenylate cyclase